tara:strand:+ start:154 stop:507 length:354 start_codon:yes stop_codon:yes gene_type:complete
MRRSLTKHFLGFLAIVAIAFGLFVSPHDADAHIGAEFGDRHQVTSVPDDPASESEHHSSNGGHVNCHSQGAHCGACAAMNSAGDNLNFLKDGAQIDRGTSLRVESPLFLPFRPPIAG